MLEKILKISIFSFLFTASFQGINFFIGTENSFFSGNFSKFSSIIFTLSDIFLFLSIFLFLLIIYKKNYIKKKKFFNFGENFLENFGNKKLNFLFFGLVFSAFLTSFFIQNFENFLLHISILLKFFGAGFLIFYIPEKIFSKKEILNTLIFSFSIQSFIAFYQVIFQAPVGLFFLGENNFGENLNGVAKIGDFIRGYGALSHPNILGLSSLILYFLARKSSLNFLKNLMIIGIFFSFSKTAIIGFFILKFYEKIFLHEEKKFFDLTNFFNPQKKFFYNKIKIFYTIFYSSIFFSIFFFVGDKILMRFQNFFGIGFQERILQFEIAEKIFVKNLENFNLFGIGFGNFTLQMQNFTDKILKPWEFQPAHNFFILFGTEVGIFGLTILLFLMSFLFFKSTKKPSEKIFLLLLLFFGSFFDHFLLSSTIGIILFWTILKNFNFFAKIPS